MERNIHKILIVKPCALGDMILALPAIRALQRKYPQAKIDLLTNKLGAVAAAGNPYLHQILTLTAADGADSMGKVRGVKAWYRLYQKLKPQHYDLAVSLRYTARNNLLAWLSGARYRIGYAIDGTQCLLTHSRPNLTKEKILPDAEYATSLLGLIGIEKPAMNLEFMIKSEALSFVSPFISLKNGRKKIALNLYSAKGRHRSLSETNILEVITYAQSLGDVYLVGSGEEKDYLDRFLQKHSLTATNMAGKCTFMQSAALLSQMDLFISTDGGALHLGRSVGIPVLALLGDSSPIQWGTHEPHTMTLSVQRSCAPCRVTKAICRNPDQCLDTLINDHFFNIVQDLLFGSTEIPEVDLCQLRNR